MKHEIGAYEAKAAIDTFQAFRKATPVHQKVNIEALIEAGRE